MFGIAGYLDLGRTVVTQKKKQRYLIGKIYMYLRMGNRDIIQSPDNGSHICELLVFFEIKCTKCIFNKMMNIQGVHQNDVYHFLCISDNLTRKRF